MQICYMECGLVSEMTTKNLVTTFFIYKIHNFTAEKGRLILEDFGISFESDKKHRTTHNFSTQEKTHHSRTISSARFIPSSIFFLDNISKAIFRKFLLQM